MGDVLAALDAAVREAEWGVVRQSKKLCRASSESLEARQAWLQAARDRHSQLNHARDVVAELIASHRTLLRALRRGGSADHINLAIDRAERLQVIALGSTVED